MGSADHARSGLTGSPSNGTSTVSPASVAEASARPQTGDRLGVSLGTSIARGKFGGTNSSNISSTAFGIRYASDTLRPSASLPYMRIRSAGTILRGIDSTPVLISTTSPGVRSTRDGLGDLTLGASYTVPAKSGLEVELSGRVKVPTASKESGLSFRRTDYAGGVQVTREIGRLAPFASATYRIFGDPRGLNLRNGLAASCAYRPI